MEKNQTEENSKRKSIIRNNKLLEKAILRNAKNAILSLTDKHQYGFRENHSTEGAILSLVDRIYQHINNKEFVIIASDCGPTWELF